MSRTNNMTDTLTIEPGWQTVAPRDVWIGHDLSEIFPADFAVWAMGRPEGPLPPGWKPGYYRPDMHLAGQGLMVLNPRSDSVAVGLPATATVPRGLWAQPFLDWCPVIYDECAACLRPGTRDFVVIYYSPADDRGMLEYAVEQCKRLGLRLVCVIEEPQIQTAHGDYTDATYRTRVVMGIVTDSSYCSMEGVEAEFVLGNETDSWMAGAGATAEKVDGWYAMLAEAVQRVGRVGAGFRSDAPTRAWNLADGAGAAFLSLSHYPEQHVVDLGSALDTVRDVGTRALIVETARHDNKAGWVDTLSNYASKYSDVLDGIAWWGCRDLDVDRAKQIYPNPGIPEDAYVQLINWMAYLGLASDAEALAAWKEATGIDN